MKKRILISLSAIVAVAAVVAGGTLALFSDTETSNGNIFTAGAIDLKVDHTSQTYNDRDCETCSVELFSSTATKIVAASDGASMQAVPANAVEVSNPHPAWQNEAALAPAQWIWATDPTTMEDTTNDATYTFENKFQWNGTAVDVSLELGLAADNGYIVKLNGEEIVNKINDEFNYGSAVNLNVSQKTDFKDAMVNGENTLHIIVHNLNRPGGPTGNPAGLLFKLNIQRDQEECEQDTYFQQTCRLWQLADLTDEKFFNFDDVKPGDRGTNVISLHVTSNDAFVCMSTDGDVDNENVLIEPELPEDTTAGATEGELSNYLNVVVWNDDNDGLHESGEEVLYRGLLRNLNPDAMALATVDTGYLGLAWCAGVQPTVQDTDSGAISCDGSGNQDDAQTDSYVADVVFTAVQQRNNDGFVCPGTKS